MMLFAQLWKHIIPLGTSELCVYQETCEDRIIISTKTSFATNSFEQNSVMYHILTVSYSLSITQPHTHVYGIRKELW